MRLLACALAPLLLSGCLNLDTFVFFSHPAPADADLMAKSQVPQDLREEEKGPIVAADGTVVDAYLLKHRDDDGTPVGRHTVGILYAHGQSNDIETSVPRTDELWKLGYTVLAFDARGYGKTLGPPTMAGQFADVRAARAYLEGRIDLGLSADRVGIYGRSLGTFIMVESAAERSPKALLLESPPLSVQGIIDDSLALDTPDHWYVDATFDSGAQIPKFTGRLLIMHGDADDYVPPTNGEKLHELATGAHPNDFWLVPGANHGDVPCVSHAPAPVDNDCVGGFSKAYEDHVTGLFDAAFDVSP